MSKNDILDQIFAATSKLELMQTVLGVLIETVEKEEANTQNGALHFAANQDMISDFLHITLDGVYFAIQTLNEAYNNNEQDKEHKAGHEEMEQRKAEVVRIVSELESLDIIESVYSFIIGILSVKKGGAK
ncbi:hypothetical protein IMSAGC013_03268 [Lachnospiraceae bacterium]|nr:hypothetical protein IMSAGC013_03268 [Lachnospiraceae bacterium]